LKRQKKRQIDRLTHKRTSEDHREIRQVGRELLCYLPAKRGPGAFERIGALGLKLLWQASLGFQTAVAPSQKEAYEEPADKQEDNYKHEGQQRKTLLIHYSRA